MIKPKANDFDHDQATINLDPLPYNPDPSQPAQRYYSFDRSSYLFPKSLSSHRMNVRAHNDSYDSPREERAPTRDEIVDAGTSRSDLTTCSSGRIADPRSPPKKKSVGFITDVTVHHLHSIPKSSDMSPKEKSEAWYGPNEYDQFKYQAAKQAGVKIVRYDSDTAGTGHHFVMCGDFDSRDGSDDNNSKDVSGSSAGCAGTGDKVYYNENEYNDRTHKNSSGKVVLNACKRGLGYHFSRSRKKSRIVTRSAVVAWQKTLREQADEFSKPGDDDAKQTSAGKTSSNTLGKKEKSAMMLALVSTKCSRVAREEAGWRGDVDYRVAYPERHASKKAPANRGSAVNNARKRSGRDRNSSSKNHPRPVAGSHRQGRSKRQRRNAAVGQSMSCSDASNRADESGTLSPTTIGYLSSVLHAEAV